MFSPGLVGIGPFPRPLVPFGASSWPLSGPCRMGNLLGNPVKFIAQCDYLVRIGALTGVRDGQRRLRSLLGPRSPKKMARSRRSRAEANKRFGAGALPSACRGQARRRAIEIAAAVSALPSL